MWQILLGLIDPISKITGQLVDWQVKKQAALTDRAKIEADENIAKLQAQRDLMIAESKTPINAIGRCVLMFPFAFFLWKVMIWDFSLGLGTTENPQPNLWTLLYLVFGFYFLTDLSKLWKR
ncbi:MAG: hypothetical protein ACXVCO_15635 [Ktedonobacterales bacterium]